MIAAAMSESDSEGVDAALARAVDDVLSPVLSAGFVVEPGGSVVLRHLALHPEWRADLDEPPDFSWVEPLLGRDVPNGASLVGPSLRDASQIGAVMVLGDGRIAYLVVAGMYTDPDEARKALSDIATEAGNATQVMRRSNERAADIAALRERERLSRDLHDSLSQSLWSLSMLSEVADSMTAPDDPLHAVIRQITEISLTSQEEMRTLLINLRTAEPSRETAASVLETLVAEFRLENNVEVVASIADVDLEPPMVMAIRRIAEEALNNVSRHANATTVAVLFDAVPEVSLRVADDGEGFDAKPAKGHLGLRVMGERAAEVGFDFDLASAPGNGTVVTASSDLSGVRPLRRRRSRPRVPPLWRPVSLGLASVLLASMAMGSFFVGGSHRSDVVETQAELDVLTVLQSRVDLSRASADEATARILAGVGHATGEDVERAITQRQTVIDEARQRVESLANQDTMSGQYALLFLDALAGAAVEAPPDQRLDQLFSEVDGIDGPSLQPTIGVTTATHSLGNLAALEQSITFGVLEHVVLRYARDPDAFAPSATEQRFFESYAEVIRGDGGFYGPDASFPFRGGFGPTSAAMMHEQEAVIELGSIIVAAGLWEDDRWLREWSEEGEPPATSLENYIERSREASVAGAQLVDVRFDARQSELLEVQSDDRRRGRLLRSAAALLTLAALSALLLSLVAADRRRKAKAIRRSIDPVTGLGGRELLHTRVEPMLQDPALSHHAMITLDMDRFSIVNEVHGSTFADRMLEVLSIGLDGLVGNTPDVRGTAVRIGDDEFLVSLHSTKPIPVEMTDQAMNRLRSTLVSAPDGTLVRCNFSYGVAFAEGNPRLESLMTACSLAMREDKASAESDETLSR